MCDLIKAYILSLCSTTQTSKCSFSQFTFIYIMIHEGLSSEVNQVKGKQYAEQGRHLVSCCRSRGLQIQDNLGGKKQKNMRPDLRRLSAVT